jgi:Fe2+ transport system protein B
MITIILFVFVSCILYIPIHIYRGVSYRSKMLIIFFWIYVSLAVIYLLTVLYLMYRIYQDEQAIKELLAYSCA